MTIVFKLIIFTTLRIIAPVAPVPSLSALPAISRCNHCVPSSIKASKKFAATLAPPPGLPAEFLKSALVDFNFSKYSGSSGRRQPFSSLICNAWTNSS